MARRLIYVHDKSLSFPERRMKGKGNKDGKLYNTKDGMTYRSKMKVLDDGRLKVSACILFACLSEKFIPAPDGPAFSAPQGE